MTEVHYVVRGPEKRDIYHYSEACAGDTAVQTTEQACVDAGAVSCGKCVP